MHGTDGPEGQSQYGSPVPVNSSRRHPLHPRACRVSRGDGRASRYLMSDVRRNEGKSVEPAHANLCESPPRGTKAVPRIHGLASGTGDPRRTCKMSRLTSRCCLAGHCGEGSEPRGGYPDPAPRHLSAGTDLLRARRAVDDHMLDGWIRLLLHALELQRRRHRRGGDHPRRARLQCFEEAAPSSAASSLHRSPRPVRPLIPRSAVAPRRSRR
jgi:hypothetical protein